jgi:hypothetical protein
MGMKGVGKRPSPGNFLPSVRPPEEIHQGFAICPPQKSHPPTQSLQRSRNFHGKARRNNLRRRLLTDDWRWKDPMKTKAAMNFASCRQEDA